MNPWIETKWKLRDMAVIAAGGHASGLCVRFRRLTNMYRAQVRLWLHLDSIAEVMGDRPRFMQCGKAGHPSSTGKQGSLQPRRWMEKVVFPLLKLNPDL